MKTFVLTTLEGSAEPLLAIKNKKTDLKKVGFFVIFATKFKFKNDEENYFNLFSCFFQRKIKWFKSFFEILSKMDMGREQFINLN